MSDDILETLKCGRPEYNEETRNYETVITKNERLAIKEITRLREELAAVTERMSKLDFERTAAELERDALREENARLIRENKVAFEAVGGVVKANDKLKEENARLREALEPFAYIAEHVGEEDARWAVPSAHLRAAAAAIREGGKGD